MLDGRVNKGGSKIFRRERINGEAQNASYYTLHHRGGVKEKDLRFGIVNASAQGLREVVE